RASVGRSNKLSVFDAMADLDLAVGQEEWNDFADESTAPPRSPTPPPPPSPPPSPPPPSSSPPALPEATDSLAAAPGEELVETVGVASTVDGSATVAAAKETEGIDGAEPTPPEPFIAGEGWPFSAGEGVEAGAEAVVGGGSGGADGAVKAESEDDDWGDFEDAGAGGGQRPSDQPRDGEETEGKREGNSVPLPDPENSEDEWGGFVDVPVALALAEEEPATTGGAGSGGSTDAPELPEVDDPFAAISPPTPPSRPQPLQDGSGFGETSSPAGGGDEGGEGTEAPQVSTQHIGEALFGTMGGSGGGPLGGSAAAAAAVAGLPLSLRDLRDALAGRGRLEEAVEVQRRMELPTPTGTAGAGVGFTGETPDASNFSGEKGDEEGDGGGDGDLERWRAAAELPPAPTLEQLAGAVSEVDAARGEKFRERFVAGRPPVEEEALAGGGAVSLGRAVKRQRAARRAVSLSAALHLPAAAEAVAAGGGGGAEAEEGGLGGAEGVYHGVLDIDLGLGSTGGRLPPSLSDWASMVAYVARVAEDGLDALKEGGSVAGAGRSAETETETENPGMGAGLASFGGGGGSGVGVGVGDTGLGGQGSGEKGDGTDGDVVREVALSARFVAFSRGLREAVRVCRMLQAAAEDGLETVDGFAAMERAWAEFRRRARQAAALRWPHGADGDGDGGGGSGGGGATEYYPDVFGPEDDNNEEEKENGSLEESVFSSVLLSGGGKGRNRGNGGGGGGVLSGSVKAVREAGVGRAPAGSALCAVCLQPLEVFGGGGRPAPDVVEYCGVRYLAAAVNLWVNVVNKPPPGPLPLDSHD
ncbi:unnamed protein product, partial [Laminaria digitata]